ncbi:imidazole glycerol phosphate synthase subunit HisH [Aestuariibacter sp. AA17]|uniref:Imidazole glycerol phosphate synthase subunit HisH n=1 Tax=Fluctibacter corallii TaxID=2984329 RepID=A0ABT3A8U9_9ALTE|nr:imidazole glycerol phosphate synthase subunit HisH [Aestuariibacter sp. AA17]MCV2885079.1 imidazole glycerol phosphate synthase subunit HisH [Aestuariibacter sp. AA17]
MSNNIVIVNTGCANIASVRYALERLDAKVTISDVPDVIRSADKIFLPGVGTAQAAMSSIEKKGLIDTLKALTQPVMGACLGMQLMVSRSQESITGNTPCLNWISGNVERMQNNSVRLPHMGWNQIQHTDHPLFQGIKQSTYFYFVHSFAVKPNEYTVATCDYGQRFSAAIAKDNFFGVQFHPERSGEAGARLLKNFVEW